MLVCIQSAELFSRAQATRAITPWYRSSRDSARCKSRCRRTSLHESAVSTISIIISLDLAHSHFVVRLSASCQWELQVFFERGLQTSLKLQKHSQSLLVFDLCILQCVHSAGIYNLGSLALEIWWTDMYKNVGPKDSEFEIEIHSKCQSWTQNFKTPVMYRQERMSGTFFKNLQPQPRSCVKFAMF